MTSHQIITKRSASLIFAGITYLDSVISVYAGRSTANNPIGR